MIPIVAVVGRPNVGKSTLFNRLVGRTEAIVHDSPGVTRDRHYADAHVHGRDVTLVDTGGLDPTTEDPMGRGIARHAEAAIAEADVVICVLDGTLPPTEPDSEAISLLRRAGKPVLYAANKIDRTDQEIDSDLHRLGLDRLIPLSALHGRATADLEAALVEALPPVASDDEGAADETPRVALIGKPNAGKSSLVNQLAGAEVSLVDGAPGTTRDPIDTRVRAGGRELVVVDTAGIRRRTKVTDDVESASVLRAIRSLGRAQVAVLLCDATLAVSDQDQRLAGLCIDRRRAVVLALNKWDLVERGARKDAIEAARDQLHFARWVPVVPLSAKTGRGVDDLVRAVVKAADEFDRRIPTSELNRFFEEVVERQPPPTSRGRAPRLYYLTQARTSPPLFVAMSNAPANIKASYRRFLVNQIRKRFGFESVPVVIQFRLRSRR